MALLLGAGFLGGAAVLVGLAPAASAHPEVDRSSPRDGAQLASAPAAVRIEFDEKVKQGGKGDRILDGSGAVVASRAHLDNRGRTLTLTPKSRLAPGRYLVTYNLISVEGHLVPGAMAFTVGTANPVGSPVEITTMPRVPTTLSAALPGSRTITITTPIRSGEVWWHSPVTAEPLIWAFHGDGTTAEATGVLPIGGDWSFEVGLSTPDSILVPKGRVVLE